MPFAPVWLIPMALAAAIAAALTVFRKQIEIDAARDLPAPDGGIKTIPPELFAKVRQIEFASKKLVESVFSGEYHSVFKGMGMEFAEVRPYTPGDDVRAIDWNVTARIGEPYIKIFNEERELTVILMVDASASGQFGTAGTFKNEAAAELCATIAFAAIRNNDKVGLYIFTDAVELHIPPAKGRRHALRIIREILGFRPQGKRTNIKNALERLLHTARRSGIVFLVSDFADTGFEPPFRVAARKYDLIAVRIRDRAEQRLPDAGLVLLRDPETGDEVLADTGNEDFRRRHEEMARRRDAELKRFFQTCGVDLIEVDTEGSPVAPLEKFFKRREKKIMAGR